MKSQEKDREHTFMSLDAVVAPRDPLNVYRFCVVQ